LLHRYSWNLYSLITGLRLIKDSNQMHLLAYNAMHSNTSFTV
jgi:hypothetical protein